jgi:tetratricopeptide (TPR) repeat protein
MKLAPKFYFFSLIALGILTNTPSVNAQHQWSNRYPSQSEIYQRLSKFNREAVSLENEYKSKLRGRTNEMTTFQQAWAKVSPFAKFFGEWNSFGDANVSIYPSVINDQVCVMVEGWGRSYSADLSIGKLINGQIRTSEGILGKSAIIHSNRFLGMGLVGESSPSLMPYVGPFNLKSPDGLSFSNSPADIQEEQDFVKEFDQLGCTNSLPHKAFKETADRYYENNEYQQSIIFYSKAIELSPRYAALYYNRGISYHLSGKKKEAIADLQKAVQLYQEQGKTSDYRDAIEQIAAIQSANSQNIANSCPDSKLPVNIKTADGQSPAYAFAETVGPNKNGKRSDGSAINAGTRCLFFKEVTVGNLKKSPKTWLVIHGWNNDSESDNIKSLAQQIAERHKGDRVLILDWGEAAYNQGRVSIGNTSIRGNYYAATWIRPVAEVAVKELKHQYDMTDTEAKQNLYLIGHSLGSIMSAEIGSIFKQGVSNIFALDPASEINILGDLWSPLGGYDVDGRTPAYKTSELQKLVSLLTTLLKQNIGIPPRYINIANIDRPKCFSQSTQTAVKNSGCDGTKQVALFSRAFVGQKSVAGNQKLASTSNESYQIDFGLRLTAPGSEHGEVVKTFATMIQRNSFSGLLGSNDTKAHFEIKKDAQANGHEGIIIVNPGSPLELKLEHIRKGKILVKEDGTVFPQNNNVITNVLAGTISAGELGNVKDFFSIPN